MDPSLTRSRLLAVHEGRDGKDEHSRHQSEIPDVPPGPYGSHGRFLRVVSALATEARRVSSHDASQGPRARCARPLTLVARLELREKPRAQRHLRMPTSSTPSPGNERGDSAPNTSRCARYRAGLLPIAHHRDPRVSHARGRGYPGVARARRSPSARLYSLVPRSSQWPSIRTCARACASASGRSRQALPSLTGGLGTCRTRTERHARRKILQIRSEARLRGERGSSPASGTRCGSAGRADAAQGHQAGYSADTGAARW